MTPFETEIDSIVADCVWSVPAIRQPLQATPTWIPGLITPCNERRDYLQADNVVVNTTTDRIRMTTSH